MSIWQDSLEVTCTWDLGKRCNLDCSYCPPHRHDLISPHAQLDLLKRAALLPLTYSKSLNKVAPGKVKVNVSFTGGEPTLNPNFISIVDYLRSQDDLLTLGVTTNGLFSESKCQELIEKMDYVTLSYHCEASKEQKTVIKENIKRLNKAQKNKESYLKSFNINLMVHAYEDYFLECCQLAEDFKENEITFTARYIGEHPNDKGAHVYNENQLNFFKNSWTSEKGSKSCKDNQNQAKEKTTGTNIGRPCCGGRSFKVLPSDFEFESIDTSESKSLVTERNFKGWYCLVNLFFIHIHQDEEKIYYHQTCQAKHGNERGPIGTFSDIEKIADDLHSSIMNKTIEPVVCPNKLCNCGLCITKSPDKKVVDLFLKHNFYGENKR